MKLNIKRIGNAIFCDTDFKYNDTKELLNLLREKYSDEFFIFMLDRYKTNHNSAEAFKCALTNFNKVKRLKIRENKNKEK